MMIRVTDAEIRGKSCVLRPMVINTSNIVLAYPAPEAAEDGRSNMVYSEDATRIVCELTNGTTIEFSIEGTYSDFVRMIDGPDTVYCDLRTRGFGIDVNVRR